MRFAFGAGGTGGHIIPALALAEELKKLGHSCFFIGNKGSMEERLASVHGYSFYTIQVQKLYRKFTLQNLLFPFYLFKSFLQSCRLIKDADAVISTGGFVAGPVALAALARKVPAFLHESNSYPGLTTRALARWQSRLYISFDDTLKHLKGVKAVNLGIPILRRELSESFNLAKLGLHPQKPSILISGGSQGSVAINEIIAKSVPAFRDMGFQLIWQTGANSYDQYQREFGDKEGLYLFDFSPHLAEMMYHADLAITRAGALTIAELMAAKLPAILIPLPTSAENHQYYNALAQKNRGLATLIQQKQLSTESLCEAIANKENWYKKDAAEHAAENRAAERIVQDILSFLKE